MYTKCVGLVCVGCILAGSAREVRAQTPMGTAFTYQGRLTDAGSPASGKYDLRFRLYDALTGGSQVGATLDVGGVDVANGLFTVPLDFDGASFQGAARWLSIDVKPFGGSTYTRLSPRQPLTPAPYSLYAAVAGSVLGGGTCLWQQGGSCVYYNSGNVGVGTTTAAFPLVVEAQANNNINPLAVFRTTGTDSAGAIRFVNASGNNFNLGITGSHQLALAYNIGVSTASDLLRITPDGKVGLGTTSPGQRLSVNGVVESLTGGFKFPDGTTQTTAGGLPLWQQNGSNIYYNGGNVGIGTTSPTAPLHVIKSAGSSILGSNTGSSGTGVYGYASYSGTCYGVRGESNSTSGIGVRGKVDATSGTTVGVQGVSESPSGRGVEGINTDGGWAGYFQGPVYVSGNVGIGTEVPTTKLDVIGTAKMTGFQLTAAPVAGYVLTANASGVGTWQAPTGGNFDLPYDGSASDGIAAFKVTNTHTGSGAGVYGVGTNYGVRGQSTGNGVYGFSGGGSGVYGSSNSGIGVEARAVSGGTALYAKGNGTTTNNPAAYIENSNSGGIAIFSTCSSTDANSVIVNKGTGDLIKGFSGSNGGDLVFKVANNGATTVGALTITGGSDLAERFDVNGAAGPGMVVMIDPDHPGKLCLSRGAYNRCVAGVISGANGVQTGMVLANLPGENHAQPVALSGRVWVRCDTSDRAIEPGDLLTTAARPGHAMAVTDFDRAHGAVLGKAMSRLGKGETGMVLALVNLQ